LRPGASCGVVEPSFQDTRFVRCHPCDCPIAGRPSSLHVRAVDLSFTCLTSFSTDSLALDLTP
jgi:hypothetical protein